jgi:hypothetical protein
MFILNYEDGLMIPLFIKKSNGEGDDFYYMGEVIPHPGSVVEATVGGNIPVVKMRFTMSHPVEEAMYNYLTTPQTAT